MKLVTYNIQYGRGKDDRIDLERIAREVAGADVIALQEVDRHMARTGEADQAESLGARLPEHHWVFGPALDLDGSARGADGRLVNRRRQHGPMLLSRWPILSSRLLLLPRFRTYDRLNTQKAALEGIIDAPGGPLRVYAVHLCYLNGEERLAQLDELLAKLLAFPREGGSVTGPLPAPFADGQGQAAVPESFVLMGDCNFTPDSAEYARVTGPPDYYYGPVATAHHLVDAWTRAGRAPGEGVTWYEDGRRDATALRLDYAFVSPDLAGAVTGCWIDEQAEGSDHQPVWLELDRPPP